MESVIACRQRVEALRHRARAQVDALVALKEIFAQEGQHLSRRDQARRLDALKEKVVQEVRDIQMRETAASCGFSQGMLISGLVNFAAGTLVAVARRSREHPLSVGIRLALSAFERTAPFGAVVVAVGPGGVPDEVNVISLSRYARELARSESEVMAALEIQGYRLMMTETFLRFLDELKEKVLKGFVTLPVANASLLLKPASRALNDSSRAKGRWRMKAE